jgi:hypothetical protein
LRDFREGARAIEDRIRDLSNQGLTQAWEFEEAGVHEEVKQWGSEGGGIPQRSITSLSLVFFG